MPPKENLFSQLPDSSEKVSAPLLCSFGREFFNQAVAKDSVEQGSEVECNNLVVDAVSKVVQTQDSLKGMGGKAGQMAVEETLLGKQK